MRESGYGMPPYGVGHASGAPSELRAGHALAGGEVWARPPEAGMPLAPFEEVGRSEAARYARWSASAAS